MKPKKMKVKKVPNVIQYAVHGYIRINSNDIYIPEFILHIIILFYDDYFNFNSNIIKDINIKHELMQAILKQLNKKFIRIKRIYSGSEHELNHKSFHKHCDNKAPTLVLCENIEDEIFGGYTTVPHVIYGDGDRNYRHLPDSAAFLFSLKPRIKIFPFKKGYKNHGIYQQYSRHIIGFGNCGRDLWIWVCKPNSGAIAGMSYPESYLDAKLCLDTEIRDIETFTLQ